MAIARIDGQRGKKRRGIRNDDRVALGELCTRSKICGKKPTKDAQDGRRQCNRILDDHRLMTLEVSMRRPIQRDLEMPRRAMEDAVFCAVVISDSAVCPYRSIVHDSNYLGAFAAMP